MSFAGQVLSWDDNTQANEVFAQVDVRLTIPVDANPNGTKGCEQEGTFAYRSDTQQLWICRTAGDSSSAVWDEVFFLNNTATTTQPGVVTLATPTEVQEGTDNEKAVTPFAIANTFALSTTLTSVNNSLTSSINTVASNLSALQSTVDDATSAATANKIIKRDSNARAQVASPSAGNDIANKTYVDAGDSTLNSAITTINTTLGNATNLPTVNTLAKRDANGRMQAVAGSAPNDVVVKSQLDAVDGSDLAFATNEPDPDTLMKRDGSGRAQVVSPSVSDDIVNKSYADALGVSTNTNSTIMRRDASGRAQVTAPSVGNDIVNKTYADALGTDAATVSTIVRRDASSRFKAADPAVSSDVATKNYADALGVSANTNSTIMRRDASGRAQVTSPSAGNDIANKTYADALGTDAATVSTIVRRDASGRFKAVDPSVSSDVATKNYADGLGVSTNTNSTIMRRDASGRAQVTSPSAANDIANKTYVDALGTNVATPSTIVRRDASGRFKAAAASASDDVVIKSQLAGLFDPTMCQALVVHQSTSPQSLSDGTSTSIYVHPIQAGKIGIYDGTSTNLLTISGVITKSLASLAVGAYRVYVYDSNADGVVDTVELVAWSDIWTPPNDTTIDGNLVKSTNTARRAIADIYLHATGTTEWSTKRRSIIQHDVRNRKPTTLYCYPNGSLGTSWSIPTATDWRAVANSVVVGESGVFIMTSGGSVSSPPMKVRGAIYAADGSGSGVASYQISVAYQNPFTLGLGTPFSANGIFEGVSSYPNIARFDSSSPIDIPGIFVLVEKNSAVSGSSAVDPSSVLSSPNFKGGMVIDTQL